MSNKHGIFEALKSMAFEEEPQKPEKTAAPEPAAAPSLAQPLEPAHAHFRYAAPVPTTVSVPIETGTVADNDEVYQKLLSRTDFETTDVAATIHKFLDPLQAIADTVMPPNVKFKTAVVQAKAQAGLTEEGILSAFDKLKAQLQQEQDAFGVKAQQFAAREVSGRQDKISQIASQVAQLQQELAELSGQLVEAQGKSSHAQSQFAAAAQRRAIEIEQQKEQYAALLKG
jgi:hypothetical protein